MALDPVLEKKKLKKIILQVILKAMLEPLDIYCHSAELDG